MTSTCVMAVRLGGEARQRTVGVAYAEPAERRLGVAEFLDNDEFSNLEVMCLKDLVLEWGGVLKLMSVYIYIYMCGLVCVGNAGAVESEGMCS